MEARCEEGRRSREWQVRRAASSQVNMTLLWQAPKTADGAAPSVGNSSSNSEESDSVKELRKQIAELQKQMQEQQ
jgi:hypothetical protein